MNADFNDVVGNDTDYHLNTAGFKDISYNPKFMMTGDMLSYYHVEPDSPVQNLGLPDWAPTYDIDGLFRGAQIWLGVDEYGQQFNPFLPTIQK